MEKGTKVKWGIMGTGVIAEQFVTDLAHTHTGVPYAVGSRQMSKATDFAGRFGMPRAYGSYKELITDPEVDVVYIATPHRYHLENSLNSLKAGKSVLCEKPITVNSHELRELIMEARQRELFLMEAMWMLFLPPMRRAMEWIIQGRIGEVRLVQAEFGFVGNDDPDGRLLNPELAGGALLDVGIYPVALATAIYGSQPTRIMSSSSMSATGVDEQFSALLTYGSGKVASLHGAITLGMRNEAVIHGTEGCIVLPSMNKAPSATLYKNGQEVETYADDRLGKGYEYEADEVGRSILAGRTDCEWLAPEWSLQVMQVLDALRDQWDLKYPFE